MSAFLLALAFLMLALSLWLEFGAIIGKAGTSLLYTWPTSAMFFIAAGVWR